MRQRIGQLVRLDGWELGENLGRSEDAGRRAVVHEHAGAGGGRLGRGGRGEWHGRRGQRERRALAAAGTGSGHKGRRKGEQTQRGESGQRASG